MEVVSCCLFTSAFVTDKASQSGLMYALDRIQEAQVLHLYNLDTKFKVKRRVGH